MTPSQERSAAKSKSWIRPRAARFAKVLRGPARRALVLALLGAGAAGGAYAVWQRVRPHVVAAPQYRLEARDIAITPPPEWIRSDLRAEVIRDASLDGPLSILDPGLAERVAKAFALHPWIARVQKVSKHSPARVEVELVYRRPVCMVEVPGGLYPVDIEGVLLPSSDFSPNDARRYPRLSGVQPTTEGPVGTRWHDRRVVGAAEIAAALTDAWNELNLHRIVPVPGAHGGPSRDEPTYELFTRLGTRILWGPASGTDAPPDDAPAVKAARLRRFFAQRGTLEGPEGPQDLDLRHGEAVVATPRTAAR